MKNKRWILAAIIIIFIIGAAFVISQKLPASFLNTNKTDSKTEDAFNMKAKCASYREDIGKKLGATLWTSYSIDEIFYSPIENSCLYAVSAYQERGSYSAYIIWDQLSGEMLFYRDTSLTNGQDITAIYQNAKQYLKGEMDLEYSRDDWELSK